jgi:hypothetical protein
MVKLGVDDNSAASSTGPERRSSGSGKGRRALTRSTEAGPLSSRSSSRLVVLLVAFSLGLEVLRSWGSRRTKIGR